MSLDALRLALRLRLGAGGNQMLLKGDSRRGPGTSRDPALIPVSNCATAGSMVAYSPREVFWGPSCASFRSDESKSFLALRWLGLRDFLIGY
ncbi:hypothetical protein HID58_066905, partial [Brassica napus]